MFKLFIKFFGKINWDFLHKNKIDWYDRVEIFQLLSKNNCIILTRRDSHLSTYLANLGHFFLTGKLGYWAHAVVNVENIETKHIDDFILIEAIGSGVTKSTFMSVFNCDDVIILEPTEAYKKNIEDIFSDIGKKYDLSFNNDDERELSCVEVARQLLPKTNRLWFEEKITPDMFLDLGLKVLWRKSRI